MSHSCLCDALAHDLMSDPEPITGLEGLSPCDRLCAESLGSQVGEESQDVVTEGGRVGAAGSQPAVLLWARLQVRKDR